MINIIIDGQDYQVEPGENLLQSCLNAGLDLPYFCWHPAMGSIGSCRQCAVLQYQNAEDQRGKIVMACMTPVSDGARFSLQADKAAEFRQAIVESLMLNHPHDCPVCAEGGECHLQDMTVLVGHSQRRYRGLKNTHRNQYLGPLINHEMNRCISCYRCVRFYRDYAGGDDLAALASHDHVYFGRHQDGVLENAFSGNLVEVCPTGVFTDKPLLKQYSRKWDLQSAPSICNNCSVGCNTMPGERYGKLKRIHNRFNPELNGYFLCDRGRFGSGYINGSQRLDYAGVKSQEPGDNSFKAIEQDIALATANQWLQQSDADKTWAIGSSRASTEANFLLAELIGAEHVVAGLSEQEAQINQRIAQICQHSGIATPSIAEIENADAILILGEDISNTGPRIALALRQSVRNKAYQLAADMRLQTWQDAAIRNLAQSQRSPLFIISATESGLDDVAAELVSLAPDQIASFGQQIAAQIQQPDESATEQIKTITKALLGAKKPLILSGSSLQHAGIVEAALAVAQSLQDQSLQAQQQAQPQHVSLSYCLRDANSMGLALLSSPKNCLTSLLADEVEIDTLLILENNLYRQLPPKQVQQLLGKAKRIIALDCIEHATLEHCDLVLATASIVESSGSLINFEGRAQRHYPVFAPAEQRLASWQWLLQLGQAAANKTFATLQGFDDVVQACASSSPVLSGLSQAAPSQDFSQQGLKIPRQSHRYSGRTAMHADVSVHEPQQPQDSETPLAYTMEGLNRDQPAALKPFVWAPGWNSNQAQQKGSFNKQQQEIDGLNNNAAAGQKLFAKRDKTKQLIAAHTPPMDQTSATPEGMWQLIALYRVHGSDELSSYTDEIAELSGPAFIGLDQSVATQLQVNSGDGLVLDTGTEQLSLEVKILSRVAKNCVAFCAGFEQTQGLHSGQPVALQRDPQWQARPLLIATDISNPNAPTISSGGRHV